MNKRLCSLAVSGALALLAGQAEAHARLVSSTPAANAAVASPQSITLHFSERLAPKFSGADLSEARGGKLDATVAVTEGKTMMISPKKPLWPGRYVVLWHAVADDDGHRTQGAVNFTVK